jgi:hypothetical protein
MKRTLLGLVMLSSLALMAAPKANAAAIGACGHSYAFQVHGDEPITTNNAELLYITGVGQITFGTAAPDGTCAVTNLEMIYNDNDVNGSNSFYAGPNHCYDATSLLGTGIPCFDGGNHQATPGSLTRSTNGNGAVTLAITPSFSWVDTSIVSAALPLTFTLQQAVGSSTIVGNSVAPSAGPTPPTPPLGPVLTITLQKQSTTVSLPKTGPAGCGPRGCTGGGNNGFGVAPYLGLQVNDFEGVGGQVPADGFAQPIGGSYGTSVGQLQIFANGQSGGSSSFNSNDNAGNTTGATNNDCDTTVTQTGNFADGASNVDAAIEHPSAHCLNAFAGGSFQLSTVLWGATDTSSYNIVTGVAAATLTGGLVVPPGQMASGTSLFAVPAGIITNLVVPQTLTAINKKVTGYVKMTNTSPAGCDVTLTMPPMSGSAGTSSCSMDMISFPGATAQPVSAVVEGDTPSTQYTTTECTCSNTATALSITSPLTITSTNCPLSGTTSYTITCKN